MADDPCSTPPGVVTQAHVAIGHASPPPPAPSSSSSTSTPTSVGQQQQPQGSPQRGPRSLLLRRSENGFGFTLRHFIVYPPESCCMLPGHERAKIDEPMDTIFVKQVRSNSPAAEAGLRTGDRVVSVDSAPTRGEQYASVVQRIQQAGPWLRLLVVSKEDDILQRYFGETAHNPETNQRPPRLRSPERLSQKQRRSIGIIPGPSPRTRQSWVCSPPGSENQAAGTPYRSREDPYSKETGGAAGARMLTSSQRRSLDSHDQQEANNSASLYDHPERPQRRQKDILNPTPQPYRPPPDTRFDLYDRTRPESVYSRPSTEQIYDRIKDPIYERVSPATFKSLERYPMSRAEPQVPIYRPGRRIVARRASEGSGAASETDISAFGSVDALKCVNSANAAGIPGSRLSVDSRRDSSPASKESLSSYDSTNSTLTGNEYSDDSILMTRLRKSFEQKEAFLRRPSHPIGWRGPEDSPSSFHNQGVIQREFYARPQKLQRQVWPPSEQQQQQQQQSQTTRQHSPTRNSSERTSKSTKPSNQNVQRVKTDRDAEQNEQNRQQSVEDIQAKRDQFYSSLYDGNGQFVKENHFRYGPIVSTDLGDAKIDDSQFRTIGNPPRSGNANGKTAFVTTLSRIHENVAAAAAAAATTTTMTTTAATTTTQQQQDPRNGTSSLPSSPGPEKKAEKFPVPPQGLQIVSRRAKQFESGRLLSDDDELTSDRTNLYKSELSRLSSKRSVPNVAVRKREFESKAESQEPRRIAANHRESKSLDAGRGLSGNRIVPVGGKCIHCAPPAGYREVKEMPAVETETVRLRARSNSAESWEAVNGASRRSARHTWQTDQDDSESKRNKAKRQDSYLQAVRTQHDQALPSLRRQHAISDEREDPSAPLFPTMILDMDPSSGSLGPLPEVTVSPPKPVRPNELPIPNPIRPSGCTSDGRQLSHDLLDDETTQDIDENLAAPDPGSPINGVVLRRQKNTQINDEDRATRRVSYLKATWGERMHVDSDLELSDSEPPHSLRSNSIASTHASSSVGSAKDIEPVEREGSLHVKFTVLDGKRSTDRSWKQVWGVLRGWTLYFYKDRHSQSPTPMGDGEAGQNVDVRCSLVDIADDYTKRKHVLRVANPTAEVLLQTEDAASMALWLRALHKHAATEKSTDVGSNTSTKQQAVPQTPGPTTPSATCQGAGQRLSPLPSHKGIRKLTSFRNRSPTGQSPVNKTRKPSQSVEQLPSPKLKTWKGRVAKQLRRMQGQASSPSSPTAQMPLEGVTFKVPLELCPPSSFSEFVPLLVEMCTSIVEARGLEVVGIYRVPGNTAAISQLTESVNKGFENINLQDPRWSDVNVISSLLKSFFRQLPDSLLTAELYPMFIDADKIEDPQRRMATIRKLLRDLPEHHFETLKYLVFHLKRVVEHSEINKMEAKNLAIVFGPTLVRASGSRDNMVTMVTDMSHQCRIVESLLNNADWFFSEEDLDDLSRLSVNLSLPADCSEVEPTSNTNHNLLLNNIQKVEGMREMVSARDIVSSIISAANRKIQRRRKGQDEHENEEHEDDKASRARQDAENPAAVRQSMALNERQCSVSEIVLMHESKSQTNHASAPAVADRSTATLPLNSECGQSSVASTSARSAAGRHSTSQSNALVSDSSRLSNDFGSSNQDAVSTISNTSSDAKQSNDEVAIRTYAGLSATTQERIRRFEQETKAMLQHRQRRDAEKREEEKKRIEMEWQLAKREMENDDILDNMVDTTVTPTFLAERLSSLNERLVEGRSEANAERHGRSRSSTRIAPVSIAVQQQPTARQKAQASSQLSSILGEKMSNGVIKKFKTDKEQSLESVCLNVPTRYGSLDSLHEVHSHSPPPPTPHHHRGAPGDISDDGSDLLTTLTSTFDRKWKSLVNPTGRPTPSSTEPSADDASEDNTDGRSPEVYRDPSLHRSSADTSRLLRSKNDAPEKDTDSTITPAADTSEEQGARSAETITPDNDRLVIECRDSATSSTASSPSSPPQQPLTFRPESNTFLDATEKDESSRTDTVDLPCGSKGKRFEPQGKATVTTASTSREEGASGEGDHRREIESTRKDHEDKSKEVVDSSYSNKLEKFESLSRANSSDSRSRLKRSESLNKKTENAASNKLKRSESLNKHSDRLASPTNNGKLKRSESLNKHSERSESPNSKLKRSESLTKTEKTECNISKRRQSVRKESATKLKRKNGMPERSIKRRHTVGGTKDFDKVHWLDNKLQSEAERVVNKSDSRPKKSQLRTSSPDLSSNRVNVSDASFLIEVSFRGPSNVVFNVTNARPQSLPDATLASKVFKVPLESHV